MFTVAGTQWRSDRIRRRPLRTHEGDKSSRPRMTAVVRRPNPGADNIINKAFAE